MINPIKKKIIDYIDNLLSLNVWNDKNSLITIDIDMNSYMDEKVYDFLNKKEYILLFETLESYEDAFLHHDWLLEEEIEGLNIPQAYLFLQEIKKILESNIPDENIEEELVKKHNQIQNTEE